MELDQKSPLTLIFSQTPLCGVFAQAMIQGDSDSRVIAFYTNDFLFPSCGIDQPFHYITEMYVPKPVMSTQEIVPPTRLQKYKEKGYSLARRLVKRMVFSYAWRQKLKKGLKKIRRQPALLPTGFTHAPFPKVTYEAVWERFLAGRVESSCRLALEQCQLQWYRGRPEIEHEEGAKGGFIVEADLLKKVSSQSRYIVLGLPSNEEQRDALLTYKNLFFVFDRPCKQDEALKKHPELMGRSAVLPCMSFTSQHEVLTNRAYLKHLIDRYQVEGCAPLEEADQVIYCDVEKASSKVFEQLNTALSNCGAKVKAVCLAPQAKVAKYSHIIWLQGIETHKLECLIKEAALYIGLSENLNACKNALYAGYYGVPILALDTLDFRGYFGTQVEYMTTEDIPTIARFIQGKLGAREHALSEYVKTRYNARKVHEEVECIIERTFSGKALVGSTCGLKKNASQVD